MQRNNVIIPIKTDISLQKKKKRTRKKKDYLNRKYMIVLVETL